MKEYIVRIPEDSEDVLTAVIEKFGGEVALVTNVSSSKEKKVKKAVKSKKDKKVSPTYLFGAWKNLDIDPDKLRKQAWGRSL